jgi:hypothetical protein
VGEGLANVGSTYGIAEVELAAPVVVGHMEIEFEISSVWERAGYLEGWALVEGGD